MAGPLTSPSAPTTRRRWFRWVTVALALTAAGLALLWWMHNRWTDAPYTRIVSANNLKQLILAAINYSADKKKFPPPAVRATDGTPLLSWRVLLLPYLEQEDLFRKFNLSEPWDGPTNRRLLDEMPKVFGPPGKPRGNLTHYRAFVGAGTAFDGDGVAWREFRDGASNTLAIVEAAEAVPWTKPDELQFGPGVPLPRLGVGFRKSFIEDDHAPAFHAAFADGSVLLLNARMDGATLRALVTRNGGEKVDRSKLD